MKRKRWVESGWVQNGKELTAAMSGERKRERVGSWDRRQKPPTRAAECRPTSWRKRSRESGA